jgi:energy-coupling factor transport system ATP-binding protein
VLDEPTSALDPAAAEDVLAAIQRLVHDLGMTVLVAEHRLERVVQYADRLVHVPGDGAAVEMGEPAALMARLPIAPPVVELGRLAGWTPLPLSIRDARRVAGPLRDQLSDRTPSSSRGASRGAGSVVGRVAGASVAYGAVVALRDVDLELHQGEVLAIMGRNGSGKSTLLTRLAGLHPPDVGKVELSGKDPARLAPREAIALVGLVPQDPGLLLNATRVDAECSTNDHDAGLPAGTTRAVLERLVEGIDPSAHPRDLSEGQRLALALAVVLAPAPPVVILDEPTRGLDYAAKAQLVEVLEGLAADGHSVVVATHDVEVVARLADRVVVLAEGEVVADGPAREVVGHSPVFAPQVAKVLAPAGWLTVDEVARALSGVGS